MAAWQFDLDIVRVAEVFPGLSKLEKVAVPFVQALVVRAFLSEQLGEPGQMLPGWLVYGTEKGDRVDCVGGGDGTTEFSVRIDARHPSAAFIETVAELARRLGCVLHATDSEEIVDSQADTITSALFCSAASKYVEDPDEYVKALASAPSSHSN